MKNLLLAILMLAFCQINAQEIEPAIHIEKMQYFSFMQGEWIGSGVYMKPDRTQESVNQHEKIEFKLGGSLLLIEGTGKDESGTIVFNAMANIFYDITQKKYKMYSFKNDGLSTEADIEIKGPQHLIWSFSPRDGAFVRYEIVVKNSVWTEKGEFSTDKNTWIPFFSMDLTKVE